jgi:hypothetical protein
MHRQRAAGAGPGHRAGSHQRPGGHAPQSAKEIPVTFSREKEHPGAVLARSIVAWHQSQANVGAGNGAAIRRHDANVNDVQ